MVLTAELEHIERLRKEQQYAEAIPRIEEYIRRHPNDPNGHNVLGVILRENRDPQGSIAAFDQALSLQNSPVFRSNLAMSLLHLGDWTKGWMNYEARFEAGTILNEAPGVPWWDGKVRDGLRLLLVQEQGQGDTVQFIRYAKTLAEAGVRTTLWSSPSLAPLIQAARQDLLLDGVISGKLERTPFDAQAAVMSLPRLLHVSDPAKPTISFPYIKSVGDFPVALPSREAGHRQLVIAWACHKKSSDYCVRSCPVEFLTPLADRDDLIFSVQKCLMDDSDADWMERNGVVDLREHLNDFRCTAAALQAVDGVITVDTSIAHIAGAMGIPTIVMLRYGADWRWHDDNHISRWYPTIQVVRQERPNDWADVVSRVVDLIDRDPFVIPIHA